MRAKIKITLALNQTVSTVQHHDSTGSYTTEEVIDKIEYEITRIQNAITIDWNRSEYRVGDMLDESTAKALVNSPAFEITVTR